MGKNPAFQFYPNDWSHDLEEHPLEMEGAWIRICCKLWWSETRGQLKRTTDQWAKVLRVDQNECKRIFEYLETWKIGDFQRNGNGEVTVISRRMLRDEIDRENNALRQKRFKAKHSGNASVTPSVTAKSQRSSSSSSSSTSKKNKTYSEDFLNFYNQYPNKQGKEGASKAWNKLKPDLEMVLAALNAQKQQKARLQSEGKFCPEWPMASSWVNQKRWEDEIDGTTGSNMDPVARIRAAAKIDEARRRALASAGEAPNSPRIREDDKR